MVVSTCLHASVTLLSGGGETDSHKVGGWVGCRAGLEHRGGGRNFSTTTLGTVVTLVI